MHWVSRTICEALEDMRRCYKTYNFQAIGSLIEEIQMLANRMEARLDNAHMYEDQRNHINKLKKEIKQLEKQKEALEDNDATTTSK